MKKPYDYIEFIKESVDWDTNQVLALAGTDLGEFITDFNVDCQTVGMEALKRIFENKETYNLLEHAIASSGACILDDSVETLMMIQLAGTSFTLRRMMLAMFCLGIGFVIKEEVLR